jgi:D-3-phosphoglycerate dehydrogenase
MRPYRITLAAGTFTDVSVEQERAGDRAVVTLADAGDPARIREATRDSDAIIVTNHPLDTERVAALGPYVKVIGRAGIGLDAIDLEAARARGIAVLHVPDYATNEVATHAVAMMLAAHRHLLAADAVARTAWLNWRRIGPITPIEDQAVGIVGYGRIGRAVARRLTPFTAAISAYDPQVTSVEPPVSAMASLDELLEASDVVMLHASLAAGGGPLLDRATLARMRPGSILVNVARGALVDETALADALSSGHIAAAALDVLTREPPESGNPLLAAPNVLLTPHIGWYSVAAEHRARADTVTGVVDYLDGAPLRSATLAVAAVAAVAPREPHRSGQS